MSNKQKIVHTNFCNYMVNKALNRKLYTVKANEEKKTQGIKLNGMTRDELILALSE